MHTSIHPFQSTTARLLAGIVAAAVCSGAAHADIPRKAPILKYKSLWENSPFTTKPAPTAAPDAAPLEEYSLLGISPVSGGYRVTLGTKSKESGEKRIHVFSNESNAAHGFTIDRVEIDRDKPLNSKVHLNTPTGPGTVVFDQAALAARAPQPQARPAMQMNAQGQPGQPGQPVAVQPPAGQPQPAGQPGGRPRPRIVPNAQTGQPQQGGRFNRPQGQGSGQRRPQR
ncbi:MAG: hypothetical protein FJ385_09500 [Verrucomicrobia bacterium]|nr:hypothetical protein [Verrucomicrobiota bacterium]